MNPSMSCPARQAKANDTLPLLQAHTHNTGSPGTDSIAHAGYRSPAHHDIARRHAPSLPPYRFHSGLPSGRAAGHGMWAVSPRLCAMPGRSTLTLPRLRQGYVCRAPPLLVQYRPGTACNPYPGLFTPQNLDDAIVLKRQALKNLLVACNFGKLFCKC